MTETDFDVIVMGAGPAGEVAAGRLADAGESVAIVEPHLVGGECSFYACMPSKALLRPAALRAEIGRVPGVADPGELDAQAILDRRDEVIHDLDDSEQTPWLEDRGITLFRAAGEITGERTVMAGTEEITARKAVIVATGSTGMVPPIEGLVEAHAWSNREVTTAKEVPKSLIVLGGGVIGVEMAQAWSSLGTSVTIIEGLHRLIGREEEFASEEVAEALKEHGVDIRAGVRAERVSRKGDDGPFELELSDGTSVEAERLLVGVGRKANVEGIGLESVGIEVDGKPIDVDPRMRAGGHDWLYAIGDVNGRSMLTHMGKYQSRVAVDNILGKDVTATRDTAQSPRVIFTDPEVAAVGYTLADAKEAGIDAIAVDVSTAGTAGASFHGRGAAGTSRLVIDQEKEIVVGATFVGPDANELLHAATIAVIGEVPLHLLFDAVPAFPTRNEIWLNLLQKYGL